MRALHVIETLGSGGAERLLVTLLPALRRYGFECVVAVQRSPFDLRGELEAAGVEVVELPRRRQWNLLGGARDIASVVESTGSRIVHAHLYFPAVCVALARVLRLTDAATCVTFHNLAYAPGVNPPGLGLWLRRTLGRLLYAYGIDRVFAVSGVVAAHYRRFLRFREVPQVVHNPIDFTQIDAVVLRDRQRGRPRIVVPGRLVREKGHMDFLEALALVQERGFEVNALLVGGGPLATELERQRDALDLASNVRMLGVTSHSEMLDQMAQATVVVVPSRHEGFGLTACEAMALRRPVIATTAGGLPEVVGEAGLLVAPRAPSELAAAMERVLGDEQLRARLAVLGRRRAEEFFSVGKIARRQAGLYHRVASAEVRFG